MPPGRRSTAPTRRIAPTSASRGPKRTRRSYSMTGSASAHEPDQRPPQVAGRLRAREPAAPAEWRQRHAPARVGQPHPAADRLPRAGAVDVLDVEPAPGRGRLLGAVQQVAPRAVLVERGPSVDPRPADRRSTAARSGSPAGSRRRAATSRRRPRTSPARTTSRPASSTAGAPSSSTSRCWPTRGGCGLLRRGRNRIGVMVLATPLGRGLGEEGNYAGADRLRFRPVRAGFLDAGQLDAEPGRPRRLLQLGRAAAVRAGRDVGAGAHLPRLPRAALEHHRGAHRRCLRRVRRRPDGAEGHHAPVRLLGVDAARDGAESALLLDVVGGSRSIGSGTTSTATAQSSVRTDACQYEEVGRVAEPVNFGTANDITDLIDLDREGHWEFNAQIQHEIFSGVSATFGWYRRNYYNMWHRANTAQTVDGSFTPFQYQGPMDSGLGQWSQHSYTLYNLNQDAFGNVAKAITTTPTNDRLYDGFEFTIDGRMNNGAFFGGSFTTEKTQLNNCSLDELGRALWANGHNDTSQSWCNSPRAWQTLYKAHGAYPLPGGIILSGFVQGYPVRTSTRSRPSRRCRTERHSPKGRTSPSICCRTKRSSCRSSGRSTSGSCGGSTSGTRRFAPGHGPFQPVQRQHADGGEPDLRSELAADQEHHAGPLHATRPRAGVVVSRT